MEIDNGNILTKILSKDQPCWIPRVGGSDWNFIFNHPGATVASETIYAMNGYYDTAKEEGEGLSYYSSTYKASYNEADCIIVCTKSLLCFFGYMPQAIHRRRKAVYEKIFATYPKVPICPYGYLEALAFWKDFSEWTHSLKVPPKVLIISPFTEEIQTQWPKRSKFFTFDFPFIEIVLMKCPVTYSNKRNRFSHPYPDKSWKETTERLKKEMRSLEFDICFLSCGSYAMPLGSYTKTLRKKAIYIGGILQIYFGITGRRYVKFVEECEEIKTPEAFIFPSPIGLSLTGIRGTESLNAYWR